MELQAGRSSIAKHVEAVSLIQKLKQVMTLSERGATEENKRERTAMTEKYKDVTGVGGGVKGSKGLLKMALVTPVENTKCQEKRGWRGHSIQRVVFYCHRVTGEKAWDLRKGVTHREDYMSLRGRTLAKQWKVSTFAQRIASFKLGYCFLPQTLQHLSSHMKMDKKGRMEDLIKRPI